MKKIAILVLILSCLISGCANLGGLISLGAAGYGIYRAVTSD
ncbi:hypothetical protein ACFL1I_06725 [Candidatus Omnitrophota bacterium]